MVDVYRPIDVEDRTGHESPHWHVLFERESDGWRHAYIFPPHIFEARAGEYGIPHDDFETLLDIVLHEPHIPDYIKPANHATDPAALKGMLTEDDKPIWLYNAPAIKHARDAHLIRVAHAKENVARMETAPGDVLDVIRNSYNPSADAVAEMARHVAKTRRAIDTHKQRRMAIRAAGRPSPLQEFFARRNG